MVLKEKLLIIIYDIIEFDIHFPPKSSKLFLDLFAI